MEPNKNRSRIVVLRISDEQAECLWTSDSVPVTEISPLIVAQCEGRAEAGGFRQRISNMLAKRLLSLAMALALLATLPLLYFLADTVHQVAGLAGDLRGAFRVSRVGGSGSSSSLVGLLDLAAEQAQSLTLAREQQMLRDLEIITARLQPFADTIRPLFQGEPKGLPPRPDTRRQEEPAVPHPEEQGDVAKP